MELSSQKRKLLINIAIFSGYVVLTSVGIANHELWSDESHHWLIARDSQSLSTLFFNLRYDGHPVLWNVLLYFISRFTHNPIYVQLLHLAIVWTAMLIFLLRAPFPPFIKLLFTLGYFPLFEYSILSRNYSLILLFLFLAITFYPTRRRHPLQLGLALFFLANTHFLGLLLAVAVLVMSVYDVLVSKEKLSLALIASLVITGLGMLLSAYQIIPPSNSVLVNTWMSYGVTLEHISRAASLFVKGFVPLPDFFSYHFWSHFMILRVGKVVSTLLTLTFLLLPYFFLKKHKPALILFYVLAVEMMAFFFFARLSGTRYFGILFVAFIAALWISQTQTTILQKQSSWQSHALTVLLIIQMVGGITSLVLDIERPFSESKNAAYYIRENALEKYPILADNCLNTTVLAYLPTQAYFLPQKAWGSFCVWNSLHSSSRSTLTEDELLTKASEFAMTTKQKSILIHHKPLQIEGHATIQLIKSFDQSIVDTENVFLYEVSY